MEKREPQKPKLLVSFDKRVRECVTVLCLGNDARRIAIDNVEKEPAILFSEEKDHKHTFWAQSYDNLKDFMKTMKMQRFERRQLTKFVLDRPDFAKHGESISDMIMNQKTYCCQVTVLGDKFDKRSKFPPILRANIDFIWFRPGKKMEQIISTNYHITLPMENLKVEISPPSFLYYIKRNCLEDKLGYVELSKTGKDVSKIIFNPLNYLTRNSDFEKN